MLDRPVGQHKGKVIDLLENSKFQCSLYACIHAEDNLIRQQF